MDDCVGSVPGSSSDTMRAPCTKWHMGFDMIVPFLLNRFSRISKTRYCGGFFSRFVVDFNLSGPTINLCCVGTDIDICLLPLAYGSREGRQLPHAGDLLRGQRPGRAKPESTSISFGDAGRLRATGLVRLRASGVSRSGGTTQVGSV